MLLVPLLAVKRSPTAARAGVGVSRAVKQGGADGQGQRASGEDAFQGEVV